MTQAQMKFKDKWFACVSLGEQTFRTVTSVKLSIKTFLSCRIFSIKMICIVVHILEIR